MAIAIVDHPLEARVDLIDGVAVVEAGRAAGVATARVKATNLVGVGINI